MNAEGLARWLGGGPVTLTPLAGGSSASVYLAEQGQAAATGQCSGA